MKLLKNWIGSKTDWIEKHLGAEIDCARLLIAFLQLQFRGMSAVYPANGNCTEYLIKFRQKLGKDENLDSAEK